jgi:RNase P protein component
MLETGLSVSISLYRTQNEYVHPSGRTNKSVFIRCSVSKTVYKNCCGRSLSKRACICSQFTPSKVWRHMTKQSKVNFPLVILATMECRTCRRKLEQGDEAIQLIEGIIGTSGFVALDDPSVFCSDECLKDSFNGGKGRIRLKRRVP